MARVLVATQPWGTLWEKDGPASNGQGFRLKIPQTGVAASINTTVYSAATGAGTVASFVTNDDGELPGYVEEGSYTLTVGAESFPAEAVSGTLGARTLALESTRALKADLPTINVATHGAAGDGTDQQTALQAAIAALPASGGVLLFPKVGGDYRYSGQLNFDGKRSVILQGQGGLSAGLATGTTLYHTGSGSGAAISARSTLGFTIRDMWVSYSNTLFTGKLIDCSGGLSGDTSDPALEGCRIGSGASQPYNAIGLYLDQAISGTYTNCIFDLNKYAVYGKATNNSYSVRHTFTGCTFKFSDSRHVWNVGESWTFVGPTVEQLSPTVGLQKAGFIGHDAGQAQHSLTIVGGWGGDVAQATTAPQIEFAGDGLKVSGFRIAGGGNGAGSYGIDVKPPTTLLNGAIIASTNPITVDDAMQVFGDSGTILIDSEEITFTGKTATTFTGCTLGANGTTAASHADNATVHLLDATQGIDIDEGCYFHYFEYGVRLRYGVRAGSASIRARGKLDGGAGALTAVALYDPGVTSLHDGANGQRGMYAPDPLANGGQGTTVLVANRALFARLRPERDWLAKSIAFGVTVAATADDAVDVGIFSVVNRVLVRLGSLGATTGRLNTTGVKEITLPTPITLQAGRVYYIGLSVGAVGGTAATLAAYAFTSGFYNGYLGISGGVTQPGLFEAGFKDAAHPLPATVAGTSQANTTVRVAFRDF